MNEPANPQTDPCLWVRDLDDILSEEGQKTVAAIRQQCQCAECKQLREAKHDPL